MSRFRWYRRLRGGVWYQVAPWYGGPHWERVDGFKLLEPGWKRLDVEVWS